ncbi:hypothetical protein BDM02DRAFT_3153063 [Thelephora ganbajun]|uniref:Uncharacterized protein n=1 Tax=Thelephora ganbajun TaxID=370292 RepID=A0ACB6ZVH5_THEGA|nr:hypothetical protein BDM02DRAFT_3153063 [Thelephora ganbajun]
MDTRTVFITGTAYLEWYKWKVITKMEDAFSPGYDPALELAIHSAKIRDRAEQERQQRPDLEPEIGDSVPWTQHLRRKEQDAIDLIVKGEEVGRYYVLLGAKGTGKTSMIFDAMASIQAEGVSICDAHPDLEVFRLRLGKALNYEFNEDSQASLFQRRDPREALNKLEKVALRYSRKHGRSPVLIINNVHHFNNDNEGRDMLLQLQQRAEAWAAGGTMTMVFSTDDFWPFFVMRRNASRMHVLSIYDLDNKEAIQASMHMRCISNHEKETIETVREAVSIVGGRLSYLSRVSKARDMLEMANHLKTVERGWLLSRIGLIEDCDDDVMDEQKWSSCSWLLLQEFVKRRKEQEDELREKIEAGEADESGWTDLPLPTVSYYECRQIMTRADFMEELDRLNIISIDINHNVRPDSFLILHAARDVVEEEGFEEKLKSVRDRIDEIESLHRTRELTFKDVGKGDRIRLTVDKGGARLVEDL